MNRSVRPSALVAALCAVAVLGLPAPAARGDHDGTITLTRPGSGEPIEILFDRYGTGHVFAGTTTDAMFGTGYLQATQKLWLMHAVRLVATGRASDLLGPAGTPSDRAALQTRQYPPQERAERYARLPQDVRAELEAFAEGVNAYLAEALTDPSKVPQELAALGQWPVRDWVADDTFATFIYATNEGDTPQLNNTLLLRRLVDTYGEAEGVAKFEDLVRTLDPDQPTMVPRDYNYHAVKPVLDQQELAQHRFHISDYRFPNDLDARAPAATGTPAATSLTERLATLPPAASLEQAIADVERLAARAQPLLDLRLGSNAQIIAPHLSATGNSLLTSGPQSSYATPNIWHQFGVHVPGVWDWTGITAVGLNVPFVARMSSHAWTVTSGISNDYFDWYVEQLNPDNPREYRFNGAWEPMACRTHQHSARGVPLETQEICRTRHGPVFSFDEANGVAYTQRRPFFGREEQLLLAFRGMTLASGVREFGTAAMRIPGTWNVFYVDDRGTMSYWYSGYHPKRRPGVDLRLVMDGSGPHEWLGVVPPRHVPHAINPPRGWLASWNNIPAGDWPSARTNVALHHSERLFRAYADGPGTAAPFSDGGVNPDGGLWDPADLWRNLQHGAYAMPEWNYRRLLPDHAALPSDLARQARDLVASWNGIRVDRDGDGLADEAGYTIAARWIWLARNEVFRDDLPAADQGWARAMGELWHVLSPDSAAPLRFDWLNGESQRAVATRSFVTAVEQLAAEHESADPTTWRVAMPQTRYSHVTALHLGLDATRPTECTAPALCLTDTVRDERQAPVLTEGYVGPHDSMNRGIFNGTVAYLDPPGAARTPRVQACSVITPGSDGHIGLDGQDGPHFADQIPLYTAWRLHDWPVTRAEVEAAGSNEFCDPLGSS